MLHIYLLIKIQYCWFQEEAKESAEQARMKESVERRKDIALEEMVISTAAGAKEQPYKEEQLSELSRALAVLASASVRTVTQLLI